MGELATRTGRGIGRVLADPASMPPLPPPLKQRISDAIEWAGDVPRLRKGWIPAPPVTDAGKRMVTEAIVAREALLSPATPEQISARAATLRVHGYVEEASEIAGNVEVAIYGDWIDVLAPYPFWAIQQASLSWLASRKPNERANVTVIRAGAERAVARWKAELRAMYRLRDAELPAIEEKKGYNSLSPEQQAKCDRMVAETVETLATAFEPEDPEPKRHTPAWSRIVAEREAERQRMRDAQLVEAEAAE